MRILTMPADDLTLSSSHSYPVPAAQSVAEITIKKSRFIARAAFANDREQALALLAQAREEFPDARHHCWAYLLGPPGSPRSQAFSDDGEPGGTAGKPILNVLQHKDVGDVMLIVIRYFGGIKLGAGGLVRAYGQAAQASMATLNCRQQQARVTVTAQCDFAQEQPIRHWLACNDGQVLSVDYTERVNILISIAVDAVAHWEAEAARQGVVYATNPSPLSPLPSPDRH